MRTYTRLLMLIVAMMAMLGAAVAQTLQLPDDYYTAAQPNAAPLPPAASTPVTNPAPVQPTVIVSPPTPRMPPEPLAKPVTGSAIDEQSISGGIGEDDRLRQPGSTAGYNLKLVFTGEGGIYLADVDYAIRDNSGRVVAQGTTYGPLLLLTLPSGTYQLEATAEGITKKQRVTVGSKGQQVYQLRYPIN